MPVRDNVPVGLEQEQPRGRGLPRADHCGCSLPRRTLPLCSPDVGTSPGHGVAEESKPRSQTKPRPGKTGLSRVLAFRHANYKKRWPGHPPVTLEQPSMLSSQVSVPVAIRSAVCTYHVAPRVDRIYGVVKSRPGKINEGARVTADHEPVLKSVRQLCSTARHLALLAEAINNHWIPAWARDLLVATFSQQVTVSNWSRREFQVETHDALPVVHGSESWVGTGIVDCNQITVLRKQVATRGIRATLRSTMSPLALIPNALVFAAPG